MALNPAPTLPNLPAAKAPRLVLDTNASLDWLVFRDPGFQPVAQALAEGTVRLLTCSAMREELSHMLRHRSLARWRVDADDALAHYDQHAMPMLPPQPGVGDRLPCTDPDDQVFIDLAVGQGARWLLTHDRALLKLARRASLRGLHVQRPRDWAGVVDGQALIRGRYPLHLPPSAIPSDR